MQTINSSLFLRRVLQVDALSCVVMALGLLAFTTQLAELLHLPVELLREAAWVLLPFAGFVGYLSFKRQPLKAAVVVVIALNAVWSVDSLLLLWTDWIQPNIFGTCFIVAQAAAVGVLAVLEYFGMKTSSTLAPAN